MPDNMPLNAEARAAAPGPSRALSAEAALAPSEFLIMLALASEPAHGYRIMQIINYVFATESRIGPGTLYRALQRALGSRLIAELDGDAAGEQDERRRLYRLTAAGEAVARAELKRLDGLARLARARLVAR